MRLSSYGDAARSLEPREEASRSGFVRALRRGQTMAVLLVLAANDALLRRFGPSGSPVYDTDRWPWIAGVEASADAIRAELDAFLGQADLLHVAVMAGLDPATAVEDLSVPGLDGTWRVLPLFAQGHWIEELAPHFPATFAAFRSVHPKANVGFSALEAHSHIEPHADPNRGALRFQLPLVVPEHPGSCRIRVGSEVVPWVEGQAIVFDLATDHEAWNESDELRVVLAAEISMPLRAPLSWCNRVAQRAYLWHPSYRQMAARVRTVAVQLDGPSVPPRSLDHHGER